MFEKRLNTSIFVAACGVLPCSIDPNHSVWTMLGGYSVGVIVVAMIRYLESSKDNNFIPR